MQSTSGGGATSKPEGKAPEPAAKKEADHTLPPMDHEAWTRAKAWIRTEIDLAQSGKSHETRRKLNP